MRRYVDTLRQQYNRALHEREFFVRAMVQRDVTIINYHQILRDSPRVAPLVDPATLPFQELAAGSGQPLFTIHAVGCS